MKKIFRPVSVLLLSLGMTALLAITYTQASAPLSIWWPTDNATLAGTQPFKAVVDGAPLQNYSMYWQVDNGQLNQMNDNYADYPHKEAAVDVSSWHWQSSGAYRVNFVAKDPQGNPLGNREVTIRTDQASQPVSAVIASLNASSNTTPPPTLATVTLPSSVITTTVVSVPAPSYAENIWWPTNGATMTGVQPFKAVIQDMPVSSYSMYWQVDNGQLNQMNDNYADYPHKEASVNLSGWAWKGSGPYAITILAKNQSGATIASKTVTVYTGSQSVSPAPVSTPAPVPPSPSSDSIVTPVSTGPAVGGNPLSGVRLYVDTNSPAANQASAWRQSRPTDAAQMDKIAAQPAAKWFGGWNANIRDDAKAYVDAATAQGSVPVLIAYNIPFRDCGGYSAGGATNPDAYKSWISGLAEGIGSRKAVVILEPDGLASISCLSSGDQSARYLMMQNAVATLKSKPGVSLYIDAGNSNWVSATDMAPRLRNAGVALADGFALNVSNFYANQDLVSFGQSLSPLVNGKHFVIDTSRNGRGPDGSNWCNPAGRSLGQKPTSQTGNPLVDAFLWLKTPGESDGACNGGPNAGVWWPEYALGLASRASY